MSPGVQPSPRGGDAWQTTPIAEYRQRISIVGTVEVDDGHGGFEEQETVIADHILASVAQLSGRDLQYAQQIEARATWLVCLRYRQDVESEHAITYHDTRKGDRHFEIVAPPLDIGERHWELQLLCREADTTP